MTVDKSRSSIWSREQDIAFENALTTYPEDCVDRWEKIADDVPGKTLQDVKNHYELLLDDVSRIESGYVPLPCYNSSFDRSLCYGGGERTGKKTGGSGRFNGEANDGGKSTKLEQDQRKGVAWTEDEHRLFLLGLEKYGKGDWRSISRNFVVTRTPTQVASHVQKYFIRLNSMNKDRRRTSIHDITSVNSGDVSVPQVPITGQTIGAGAGGSSGKSIKQSRAAPIAPVGLGMYGTTTNGQPVAGPLLMWLVRGRFRIWTLWVRVWDFTTTNLDSPSTSSKLFNTHTKFEPKLPLASDESTSAVSTTVNLSPTDIHITCCITSDSRSSGYWYTYTMFTMNLTSTH